MVGLVLKKAIKAYSRCPPAGLCSERFLQNGLYYFAGILMKFSVLASWFFRFLM